MTNFDGFPSSMKFTPVPDLFINMVMPDVDGNILKCMLYVFQTIYSKKGYVRYASLSELISNHSLSRCLKGSCKPLAETLTDSLSAAVKQGLILDLPIVNENGSDRLYFLNTPKDRQTLERIHNGDIKLPTTDIATPITENSDKQNIFIAYEENIGVITPIIAEELKDALIQYSEEWIYDAIREAVNSNKRNWRYISRILERWSCEGKKNGTHQPQNETNAANKYINGVYGHLIRR